MSPSPLFSSDRVTVKGRESVAVIGGGLSGSLTALMLARNGYHVTLIEQDDHLFPGASRIASRLHLGGEYPKDAQTQEDCLKYAMLWKLLMPGNIYTRVAPMKFSITEDSQKLGEKLAAAIREEEKRRGPLGDEEKQHLQESVLTPQEASRALTLEEYLAAYEKVRGQYETYVEKISRALGWNEQQTQDALFKSYKKGAFYRPLAPAEYEPYQPKGDAPDGLRLVGGIQTQELGLNVPKYLGMIEHAIRRQEQAGNIEVLTGHTVRPRQSGTGKPTNNSIRGMLGRFRVYCTGPEGERVVVHASQVVQAAGSGGLAITPNLGNRKTAMHVYLRAMLMLHLPHDFNADPIFILRGQHGGMLSPYDKDTAICYLPVDNLAYVDDQVLTSSHPGPPTRLSFDAEYRENQADLYLRELKKRFPALEGADQPKWVLGDTLNFHELLHMRRQRNAQEGTSAIAGTMGLFQRQVPQLVQVGKQVGLQLMELQKGIFTMYPTKATYAAGAALQAVAMVQERSRDYEKPAVESKDPLEYLLDSGGPETPAQRLARYSLADMEVPRAPFYETFFKEHPDFPPAMLQNCLESSFADRVRNQARRGRGQDRP